MSSDGLSSALASLVYLPLLTGTTLGLDEGHFNSLVLTSSSL